MLLYKFNIFLLVIFFSAKSFASFSDMDCFKANFSSQIEHKAAPFGLSKNILKIVKNQCVLTIEHEKLKYLKSKWIIDICRGPIHIKLDTGSIDVMKRVGSCSSHNKENYCEALTQIESILQDDGLIFAEGVKEDINTEHGKVYCASLLIDAHLRSGLIFDWTSQYNRILKRKSFKERPLTKILNQSGNVKKLIPADF